MAKKLTLKRIMRAVERQQNGLDNPGFCVKCGEEADGCEPDARGYPCEACGAPKSVYGAEELLLMGVGAS